MSETGVVLWKGSITQDLVSRAQANSPIIQSRFFLPGEVVVGRYGVVGVVIADSKPEARKLSYTEGDWYMDWEGGQDWTTQHWEVKDYDPVRKAHFIGTKQGFSLIRAFGLPDQVVDVFERDRFLGEPFITKCACDGTLDAEFDEVEGDSNLQPVAEAMPLIKTVTLAGWEAAGLPHDTVKGWRQLRTWLSFHGWFSFEQTVGQAQVSMVRAVANFDQFMERFAPKLEPYTTSLTQGAVRMLPEKT